MDGFFDVFRIAVARQTVQYYGPSYRVAMTTATGTFIPNGGFYGMTQTLVPPFLEFLGIPVRNTLPTKIQPCASSRFVLGDIKFPTISPSNI